MANRFRWLALGLMPALFAAGAALAQQAPIDLAPAAAAEKSAKPAKTAAAAPLPAAEAVARANAWLDAMRVMTADFVQIGPDGRRSEGSSASCARAACGSNTPSRRDSRSSPTAAASPLSTASSTPRTSISLARRRSSFFSPITSTSPATPGFSASLHEGNAVTIEIEDRAALGGTAHLTLVFDASSFALRRWTVIDAQGFQTVVTLSNLDLTTRPDPALFHIDELPANQPGNRRK